MSLSKIQLIGAGGLALDIISCFSNEINITGVWDDNLKIGSEVLSVPILGKTSEILHNNDVEFIISVGNPIARKMLYEKFKHLSFATLIHSTASLFDLKTINIGKGSILMPQSYITSNVFIHENVLLHIAAGLHHDVTIKNHSVIIPGAKITCSYISEECFRLNTNEVLSRIHNK